MAQHARVPFSRRLVASPAWVDGDVPPSARVALAHLLDDLVERAYVRDWIDVAKELTRIGRVPPTVWNRGSVIHLAEARDIAIETLNALEWPRVMDFCERLHHHLAQEVRRFSHEADRWYVETAQSDVQRYIEEELERILLEENLAFRFHDGRVERRGGSQMLAQVERVEATFGDARLNAARVHFRKALGYFHDPRNPDFANVAKEAVCAVEAAARSLFPDTPGSTLGKLLPAITGSRPGQVPRGIADSIKGLYVFRNSTPGVGHGSPEPEGVAAAHAEYILAASAAQIVLLHRIASEMTEDPPF